MFDLLTRPGPDLGQAERDEVKKVAQQLLEKLKQLLVLELATEGEARAQVKLAIEEHWIRAPARVHPDLYKQKCSAVFEHFYETYGDRGVSIYR